MSSQPSPVELKEIRKEEPKKAAKMLGMSEKSLVFFGIEYGMLEQNRRLAQEKITDVLESYRGGGLFPTRKGV